MAEPPAKKRKLPALAESFSTKTPATDSPSFHQGRVRAAPHVVGQWAAHIYLELQPSADLRRALEGVEAIAAATTSATVHSFLDKQQERAPSTDTSLPTPKHSKVTPEPLHLSLSRPLLLQTSQRVELRTAVSSVARKTQPFSARFASFGVLENDELTRRFLGIEIGQGYTQLSNFVREINAELVKMRLPPYYETPRFHTSLVWSTTTSASAGETESPAPRTVEHEDEPAEDAAATSDAAQAGEPPIERSDATDGLAAVPFGTIVVQKLEKELGKRLREDEFYVCEVCVKIGKEVKRFPLA